MKITTPALDADDLVTLEEFVSFWRAKEIRDEVRFGGTTENVVIARKISAVRMLSRSNSEKTLPEPVGVANRAKTFRLGALARWMLEHSPSPSDAIKGEVTDRAIRDELATHLEEAPDGWLLHHTLKSSQATCNSATASPMAGEGREITRRIATLIVLLLNESGDRRQEGRSLVTDSSISGSVLEGLKNAGTLEEAHPELAGVTSALLGEWSSTGAASAIDAAATRLAHVLAHEMAGGRSPAQLLEHVLAFDFGPSSGFASSQATQDTLSRAMVAAAGLLPGQRVVDLASGEGNLLLAVAQDLLDRGSQVEELQLKGFEPRPVPWAISRVRFFLHEIPAELVCEASLDDKAQEQRDLGEDADVVLCDPPLNERGKFTRWLMLAGSCLTPDGLSVVVLPEFTFDGARKEWTRIGNLRASALVYLGSGMRLDAGEPLGLWVLGGPSVSSQQVLLASVASPGIDTEIAIGELRDVLINWRAGTLIEGSEVVVEATDRLSLSFRGADEGRGSRFFGPTLAPKALSGDLDAIHEAVAAARTINSLIGDVTPSSDNGSLRSYATDEQRRAVRRLLNSLEKLIADPSTTSPPKNRN